MFLKDFWQFKGPVKNISTKGPFNRKVKKLCNNRNKDG